MHEEIASLKYAFSLLADEDETICFFELLDKIENNPLVDIDEQIVIDLLKKTVNLTDLTLDIRIDFENFLEMMKKALGNEVQIIQLYKFFDPNGNLLVNSTYLSHVSKEIGYELSLQQVRTIMYHCSKIKEKRYISLNTFFNVMMMTIRADFIRRIRRVFMNLWK